VPGVRIIYSKPAALGWNVITVMVELAAELFDAELVVVSAARSTSTMRKASGRLPRRRGADVCLVIAPEPWNLNAVLRSSHWTRGFGTVAGWVMDPWWDDRIPQVASTDHYDLLFVTEDELVEPWSQRTGRPVSWVPTGSDVLRHGSGGGERPVDLQRIGRQPSSWEDDSANERACNARGLRYGGSTPLVSDHRASMDSVLTAAASAKFTLSFTNRLSPAAYTHPTREYLTGRWADALASGAVVAGVVPDCRAARDLLWPEATLDLGGVDRDEGLLRISEAVQRWSPEVAAFNHARALERLDWRWRFRSIADTLGAVAPRVDDELARVSDLAASVS
jgi:hypothetical protein